MQMRRSMQHIGWAVLLGLVIAGCSRYDDIQAMAPSSTSSALVAVDSLMWLQPDSALALLLPWFDSAAAPAEYDRHYAHLLLSELLYKNYCEQTNRAELLQAESYFDSISLFIDNHPHIPWSHCGPSFRECGTQSPQTKDNISFLSARAHYMDGVGHYERDSLVPACREYLKALEIMEGRFGEKELAGHKAMFMALTYTRLTFLFSDSYLHEQAIQYGKSSIRYYQRYDASPWHLAWILDEIGAQYEMMGHFDSACFYFNEAAKSLTDTSILMHRDIITHQIQLEYKMKGDAEASVQQMHQVLLSAQDDKEKLSRYMVIGEIYYYEKSFDSALYYLSKVYKETSNIGAKKQAAEWIVGIYKAKGYDSKILEYAEFLVPFANQEENQSAIKSQLTELYNAFRQKKMEFRHQALTQRNKKLAIAVVGGLFFALFVLLIIYLKRKHHFKAQLEAESYAHSVKQKALASRLKKSNDSLREQAKTIGNLQKAVLDIRQLNANKGDYESFLQEPVCKGIRESLDGKSIKRITTPEDYPDLGLDSQQLLLLAKATEKHFKGFEQHLLQLFPKITPLELDICRLLLLGVNEKQVSILLRRDYSTIMGHVRKMKKAFGTEKSLVSFIRSFH